MNARFLLHWLFTIFMCLYSLFSKGQINCNKGQFYGLGSDGITYSLSLSGSNVTLGPGVTFAASSSRYGLAIADLGGGHAFYSSGALMTASSNYDVLTYAGSSWSTLITNPYPNILNNAGGKGNYLYYHLIGIPSFGSNFKNRIYRVNGTSLSTIYSDTTVFMQVADIVADNNGNVYFFSGDSSMDLSTQVSQLHVISPTGTMLATYPVSFDGDNAYGVFMEDSTLYVGLGQSNLTHPNSLLPITLSGSTATVGAAIPMPHPVIGGTIGSPVYLNFSDLASCSNAAVVLASNDIASYPEIEFYPNPVNDNLQIRVNKDLQFTCKLYDISGRLIQSEKIHAGHHNMDLHALEEGIYLIEIQTGSNSFFKKITKSPK